MRFADGRDQALLPASSASILIDVRNNSARKPWIDISLYTTVLQDPTVTNQISFGGRLWLANFFFIHNRARLYFCSTSRLVLNHHCPSTSAKEGCLGRLALV